ncbi:MAG: helix-turn-helix transcriptional regulator [Lachnospiraceae bacterium]|nr:helix-turn-helix transcriptional regulator [Lachnospiraceae bacterium]
MSLGNHLFQARKKKGFSQEEVAEKLGVTRQTISKWETDETLPDIRQSKRLAVLYGVSLDELITFDIDVKEIQEAIDRTSQEVTDKIDWTKAWGKKYPILAKYQNQVDTPFYAGELGRLLEDLEKKYGYEEQDAFLVLKDILAVVWKERGKVGKQRMKQ